MRLYHVTTEERAQQMRQKVFHEVERKIGITSEGLAIRVSGLWFCDRPIHNGRPVCPSTLPPGLEIVILYIPDSLASFFEIVTTSSAFREWCIPLPLAARLLRPEETE